MTKPTKLSAAQEEIVRAQNDARLRLPADLDKRLALIADYRLRLAQEKDAVKEAKEEVNAAASLKSLTTTYGMLKEAVKAINIFAGMSDPAKRAAAIRQTIGHVEDAGYIYRDLFDDGAVGVVAPGDDKPVFDATSEGKRRGGDTAQPRTVEQMAESNTAPTPGLDLSTPEARADVERQLEEYLAANPPKRGPVPKERKRLEGLVAEARAIEAAGGPAPADAEAEIPELPEAEPGQVSKEIAAGAAESEAHLKDQIAQAEEAPAAERPKRTRKAKVAEAAPPAPPGPPVEAGPSAPPAADEDDEDDSIPMPGHPHRIGDQPSTFRIG